MLRARWVNHVLPKAAAKPARIVDARRFCCWLKLLTSPRWPIFRSLSNKTALTLRALKYVWAIALLLNGCSLYRSADRDDFDLNAKSRFTPTAVTCSTKIEMADSIHSIKYSTEANAWYIEAAVNHQMCSFLVHSAEDPRENVTLLDVLKQYHESRTSDSSN